MPKIRCLYADCSFLEGDYCEAPSVKFDPDMGCLTYAPLGEVDLSADWDDKEDNDDEDNDWLD